MKTWRITGLCAILTLGFLLVGGCTSPVPAGSSPAALHTPQIDTVAAPATPSPTTMAASAAKYMVGDIVWRNESNYDTDLHRSRGMIVLQVNAQSYHYQYVSKDDGNELWSQIYPNAEIATLVSFEETYPRIVDHALSVTSQYPSRTVYEKTLADESCNLTSVCPI